MWVIHAASPNPLQHARDRKASVNLTVIRNTQGNVKDAERQPSAAARDQHSTCWSNNYLRSTLSRRQLQALVRCGVGNDRSLSFPTFNPALATDNRKDDPEHEKNKPKTNPSQSEKEIFATLCQDPLRISWELVQLISRAKITRSDRQSENG
jgi:hypothetical protein